MELPHEHAPGASAVGAKRVGSNRREPAGRLFRGQPVCARLQPGEDLRAGACAAASAVSRLGTLPLRRVGVEPRTAHWLIR